MNLKITTATEKIQRLTKRIRGVSGGTGASKTISIIFTLCQQAQDEAGILISIVAESLPALKRGAIRNFLDIMGKRFVREHWNKTDFVYTFSNDSKIEFFSVDEESKVRGARRDVLFINEANNIHAETYNQLEVRTNKTIWLDWNPTAEFWFYTEVLPHNDVDFITLTYKDNEMLNSSIIASIESRKHNTNWFRVYGEGQMGLSEAQIYSNWELVDKIPEQARFVCAWLDFGYTNDPTAAGLIYYYDRKYYLDELIYKTGLTNYDIGRIFKRYLPVDGFIVADSAEPKSIAELEQMGLAMMPSAKGRDSVLNGIQVVQGAKICVTTRSVNIIKEQRNYLWETDKNGKIINIPSPDFNHHMDGIRYAFLIIDPNITGSVGRVPVVTPFERLDIEQVPSINKGLDLTQFWDATPPKTTGYGTKSGW